MSKNKEANQGKPPTKKQISQWQKQNLRQRIIGVVGAVTIIAALAVMISGWYFKQYVPIDKPMKETVVEINGQKYSMAYYIDAIEYMLGDYAADYASYYLDYVENSIEQVALIKAECAGMGIAVTDKDIDQYITENNIEDDNQAVRDIIHGQLLIQKLESDYFEPEVPSAAEYREVLAMFLESRSQLDDIKARIDAGAEFGDLAAEYSLESTTKSSNGALGALPRGLFDYTLSTTGLDEAIYSRLLGSWGIFEDADKSKQIGYWLVKVTERKEDGSEAHVSAMLLSSMEEALSVKTRLETGEDFTALAEQYSQRWSDSDKDDLGWIPSESTAAYAAYIFAETTQTGAVSDPIKDTSQSTDGGCWLFKSLTSETKDISSEDREKYISKAYNEWVADLQKKNADNVHKYLDETQRAFAVNYFKEAQG